MNKKTGLILLCVGLLFYGSANSEVFNLNSSFIPNKGQIIDTDGKLRSDILYKTSRKGIDLYLTKNGMSFVFFEYERPAPYRKSASTSKHYPLKNMKIKMYRMDLDIVGMNQNFALINRDRTQDYFNYYYPHCPQGVSNVYGYREVIYENVYQNIDLLFHSQEEKWKYDFIVKPGGNVSQIKLKYRNADAVSESEGRISALNAVGRVESDKLHTFQSDGKLIESKYVLEADGTISISVGEYDETQNLIIDPFIGATYYGGNDSDVGNSINTDGNDNIIITGGTTSSDFPVLDAGGGAYYQTFNAGVDIVIVKFNDDGVRQWATYYGGSDYDEGFSVAADGNNSILITGDTESTDLPLQDAGGGAYFQNNYAGLGDVFILKFNSAGVREWATYYGGTDEDEANSITADGNNNILVTGGTRSTDLTLQDPGSGAYYQASIGGSIDAYILKFSSGGVHQWGTYYGGSAWDEGTSITADGNNQVLLSGITWSFDLPLQDLGGGAYFQNTQAGSGDIMIIRFDPLGVRQWATFYGGSDEELENSIITDGNNNVLITGTTFSTDLPIYDPGGSAFFQGSNAAFHDIYILKFDTNGIREWATYYGGNSGDWAWSIASDNDNSILISGETMSGNFPLHNPGGGAYFQNSFAGDLDVVLAKFDSNAVRQWSTYYGGSGFESGLSISSNSTNHILVTGFSESTNFPVFDPGGGAYYQGSVGGFADMFLASFNSSGVIVTGIQNMNLISPDNFYLAQNYPNPFNPSTTISWQSSVGGWQTLKIYDILGREVATLVNARRPAGEYQLQWDASGFPSGVYFYQLKATPDDGQAGSISQIKKMLLLK